MNKQEQLLRDAYEWWHYSISVKENNRLIKKYYPNEPTGSPRFFMDTDKLRIYMLENGIKETVEPEFSLEAKLEEAKKEIAELKEAREVLLIQINELKKSQIDKESIKKLRDIFGEHDKTPFEHWAYNFLNKMIQ